MRKLVNALDDPSSDRFARGARVRGAFDLELTMLEAAFVMCALADQDGVTDEEEFVAYMRKALRAYKCSAEGKTER